MSAGARFRAALEAERPLQIVGTINAFTALLAEKAGFRAIYLSGAGVANASFGLPDLAMTTLNDVCEDIRRIASATDVPLLVDADTGWGSAFMIGRTIREMTWAGAAGCHLEDQVAVKRCGHRPGKALVETAEMCDRIKAAVDGRIDDTFVIMARTDAHAVEGQQAALDRAAAYVEAGADMIFAEALTTLDEYREFTDKITGAGAGQPDRVRPDAAVYDRRTGRRGYSHGSVPTDGVSRHVEDCARRLHRPARERLAVCCY